MFEYVELSHAGVYGIRSIPNTDSRGEFLRLLQVANTAEKFEPCEISLASNLYSGTLRGMHFQRGALAESKVISCISGRIFDVGIDLRENSPSYLTSVCVELGPKSEFQGLLLPSGYAHGYMSLEDNSQIIYVMDKPYSSTAASGYRWDDKAFDITWPISPKYISVKDMNWEDFKR